MAIRAKRKRSGAGIMRQSCGTAAVCRSDASSLSPDESRGFHAVSVDGHERMKRRVAILARVGLPLPPPHCRQRHIIRDAEQGSRHDASLPKKAGMMGRDCRPFSHDSRGNARLERGHGFELFAPNTSAVGSGVGRHESRSDATRTAAREAAHASQGWQPGGPDLGLAIRCHRAGSVAQGPLGR